MAEREVIRDRSERAKAESLRAMYLEGLMKMEGGVWSGSCRIVSLPE